MHSLSQEQVRALLRLLETEADHNRPVLKQALASAIKTDPAAVQGVLEKDFARTAPRPIVEVLEEICWEDLSEALAHFAAKINPNIEEGLSLLAKFAAPTTSRGKIAQPLDDMALELRPVLLNTTTAREAAKAIGLYIFNVKKLLREITELF